MRRLGLVLATAMTIAACGSPIASSSASPSAISAADAILVVGADEQVQAIPRGEVLANAFNSAMQVAEANGVDVGYPWIDPATGELVLSAVTPRGRSLLEAARPSVPFRIRTVPYGAAELRRIQDGATFLRAEGVADANLIYQTLPDDRDNRAMIVICRMSQPLVDALPARWPFAWILRGRAEPEQEAEVTGNFAALYFLPRQRQAGPGDVRRPELRKAAAPASG